MKFTLLAILPLLMTSPLFGQEIKYTIYDTTEVQAYFSSRVQDEGDTIYTLKDHCKKEGSFLIYFDRQQTKLASRFTYIDNGQYYKQEHWNYNGHKQKEDFAFWDTTASSACQGVEYTGVYSSLYRKNWYWNGNIKNITYFIDENRKRIEFYESRAIQEEQYEQHVGFGDWDYISIIEYYENGKIKKLSYNCWEESEKDKESELTYIYLKCNELYWNKNGKQIDKEELEKTNNK